jgi:hypothetical protein
MADIVLDQEAPPTATGGAVNTLFPHSSTAQYAEQNNAGYVRTLHGLHNSNTADVVANAADTYLTGSNLAIPSHKLQVGTKFTWVMAVTKTNAGVATPIWSIRVGTAGSVADTALLTLTGPAQTAVPDTAYITVEVTVRSIGASGVISGVLTLTHNLDATGFANIGSPTLVATSAGFNTTTAGLIIGISVNPGALGVWTHTIVDADAWNI